MEKNILRLKDVAELTGFSKSWLYRLTSDGKIPCSKPGGHQLFFDRATVEAWIKNNPKEPKNGGAR